MTGNGIFRGAPTDSRAVSASSDPHTCRRRLKRLPLQVDRHLRRPIFWGNQNTIITTMSTQKHNPVGPSLGSANCEAAAKRPAPIRLTSPSTVTTLGFSGTAANRPSPSYLSSATRRPSNPAMRTPCWTGVTST
jgi:hypothetical protein